MRGHPVLGAVAGFFFGVFFALLLQQLAIWPLDNVAVIGFPIAGILLGLAVAAWAPFGRRSGAATPAARGTGGAAASPPKPPEKPASTPEAEDTAESSGD